MSNNRFTSDSYSNPSIGSSSSVNTRNVRERSFNSGRAVEDEQLFEDSIYRYMRGVGWENFIEASNGHFYPHLVEMFYENLLCQQRSSKDDLVVTSTVLNVRIQLDRELLAALFGIPDTGECIFFKNAGLTDHVSIDNFNQAILNTATPGGQLKKMNLRPEFDCLNTYLKANIIPSVGHREKISRYRGFVLYCLVVGRQLNLPFIMLKIMKQCSSVSNKSLGYASLLTKIFKRFKVPLQGQYQRMGTSSISSTTLRLHESHPVRDRTPTQHAQEPDQNPQMARDDDVYHPYNTDEPINYVTQDLNSNDDFTTQLDMGGSSTNFSLWRPWNMD